MELLIVRHGPAGNAAEKDAWRRAGRSDSSRPLTKDGRRRTRAAAAGLARVVSDIALVGTSPYARAAQTASILAKALGADVVECPPLTPGRPHEEVIVWLRGRNEERIALVGHEPHLSCLACFLLTGRDGSFLSLKKPQAIFLELKALEPGRARLIWSLPPRQLRDLGGF